MAFDAAVEQVQIRFGRGFFLGDGLADAALTITPVFTGTAAILWDATDDYYLPFGTKAAVTGGAEGSVTVPRVDQTGWLDMSGALYRNWMYKVTVTYTRGVDSLDVTKYFQPRQADMAAGIDFEALPTNDPSAPVSTLPSAVKTVAGYSPGSDGNVAIPNVADVATGGRLGPLGQSVQGSDFNTLLTTGFYRGNNMTNAPLNSTGWFYILVESHDTGNWTYQQAIGYATGTSTPKITYQRQRENGTWSPWIQMADSSGAFDGGLRAVLNPAQRLAPLGRGVDGQDLNSIVDAGWYNGANLINAPGSGYWYIQQLPHSQNTWAEQQAFQYGSGVDVPTRQAWYRQKVSGTWSAWFPLTQEWLSHDRDTSKSNQWMRAVYSGRALPSSLYTGTWTPSYDDIVGLTPTTIDYLTEATLAGATAWNMADGYFALLRTIANNTTNAPIAVSFGLSADDRVSVYLDGVLIKSTTTSGPISGGVQFTMPPGQHTVDIILYENAGSDYVYGLTPYLSSQVGTIYPPRALDLTEEYTRYMGSLQVSQSVAQNGQVFARNGSGNLQGIAYSANALANYLAQRDANGQLPVPTTPTINNHAAAKQYVDNKGDSAGVYPNANATGAITLTEAAQGNGVSYRMAMTGDITFTLPIPADTSHAWTATLRLTQPNAGGAKVTWPTHIKWAGGKPPVLSTAGQAIDIVTLYWDGNIWYGMMSGMAFA